MISSLLCSVESIREGLLKIEVNLCIISTYQLIKKNSTLILSSYKVMFSFLQKQEELNRIFWNKKTFHLAILNKTVVQPKAFLLLRDPEARFISYFKDKFRK
ncbi:MAG: hypothetical protein AAF915_04095 [Cyanobacteria bacterium P01_D01_bin.50]